MRRALAVVALFGVGACAQPIISTKIEDGARRSVPVAICLKPLARHGNPGAAPVLAPQDYWSMILPSFDPAAGTVDLSSPDCSGRNIFASPELLQSDSARIGPVHARPEDVITGQGPDGFRVIWLRTHSFTDGSAAGPIALVRPREAYGEVYAIGLYRGSRAKSRFALERLGFDLAVSTVDDGCADVKGQRSCETVMTAYLLSAGQLIPAARIPIDRLEYKPAAGASGMAQFRLTATPLFQDRSIRVLEQLAVTDPNQGVLRKSELERLFTLRGRAKLVPNVDSLWAAAISGGGAGAAKETAPPGVPKK